MHASRKGLQTGVGSIIHIKDFTLTTRHVISESFHCIYTIWCTQVHAHLYEHSHTLASTHTYTFTTYKHIHL